MRDRDRPQRSTYTRSAAATLSSRFHCRPSAIQASRSSLFGAEPSWPSTEKQGSYRVPQAGVAFDAVVLTWNMNQGEAPLAPTRRHVVDHFALSVANLDAWVAKLRGENVHFLEQTYRVGDTRAVMIEGPSREAIELVEVK